jgi:predicted ATPase
LGVPPEEETVQVYQAIKEKRDLPPPVDRFAKPLSPQKAVRKHNLPVQPTPFVGREAELAELARLLANPGVRLVTILGAGGMGKTRLALEATAAQLDNYAHGVFFVPLAPLQSVEAIVPTVAEALSFSLYQGGEAVSFSFGEAQQQLLDYLRQKSMLLMMDSFEHLLDGVGLVTDILRTAPDVKILTTSRARLNVQGEHLFPIAGMDFPKRTPKMSADASQYSAVKLFLASACRAQPSFEPTADDRTYLVQICRLVQGMPLGILLSAAWVGMLTPAEIATEIGQSLDFLETDLRDVPERQQSIRAVFDHSWNLLTEREREVLGGLSVFRGGFTRQAARQITGASLRELRTLVNKSLLHRTPTPSAELGTGGRYEMHELLRQYAAEKLDGVPAASQAVHDWHCAYYTAFLQQREAGLKGAWQQTELAQIEGDSENARAAWNWAAAQGQVERLAQAIDSLCLFYEWRVRYQEGEAACRMAAEKLAATASGDGLRVLAKILTWQSGFNQILGHTELASQLLEQSLALLEGPELADRDTRPEKAAILGQMGRVLGASLDLEGSRRLYEQSLALYRAMGDQSGMGVMMGHLSGLAMTLEVSGEGRQLLGKFAEAHSLLEESVAIYNNVGMGDWIALANISLGSAQVHLGQYEQAHTQGELGLTLSREAGCRRGIGYSCWLLGCVALAGEAYAEAQQWLQESVAVYQEIGQWNEPGWALATLGYAARGLGNMLEALQHLYEALQTATETWDLASLMLALPAIALLLADQGEKERAVELYALASRYPLVANSRWFEDVVGNHIAAVAATLPPDVVAAAQERGRARDLEATVAKLLAELGG